MEQERIHDQQADRGEREDPARGDRPTEERRGHHERRHRARPEHRRLPAGHRAEHHQDREPADEPAAEPQRAEQRLGDREDERDVGAGDREQVAEAGVAEVVDEIVRDRTGVAEQEAGEQRAFGRRAGPRRRAAPRRATGSRAGRAVSGATERDQLVTRSVPTACRHRKRVSKPLQRLERARRPDPVAGLEHPQLRGLLAAADEQDGAVTGGRCRRHGQTSQRVRR